MREMQQVDIKNVNADELVDISEIEIDTKQSVQRRVKEYVEQVDVYKRQEAWMSKRD